MSKDAPETKNILAHHGPYAGQVVTVPAAVADQAIADGWAIDPYLIPPAETKEQDDAMLTKARAAAHAAAAELRGEVKPKKAKAAEAKPVEVDEKKSALGTPVPRTVKPGLVDEKEIGDHANRSMQADTKTAPYATRQTPPASKE